MVYLHIFTYTFTIKNQPNVREYIPYMDPMGNKLRLEKTQLSPKNPSIDTNLHRGNTWKQTLR